MPLLEAGRYSGLWKPSVGTQINSGHPLASGLKHMLVLNELAGRLVADVAQGGNVVNTLSGGGTPPAWQPGGLHWAGTWTNSTTVEQIQIPARMGTTIPGSHTLEAWVKIPAATTGAILLLENSDGNTNGTVQGIGIGVGNTTMDNSGSNLIAVNEAVAWHSSGVAIPANIGKGYTQIGLVFNPSPGTSVFFIGGRRVATASYAALGAASAAQQMLYVGGYYPQGKGSGRVLGDGCIGLIRHYNRALTDAEMAWLSVEPFSMMQPSGRMLSRSVSATAAPPASAWHTSAIKVWQ